MDTREYVTRLRASVQADSFEQKQKLLADLYEKENKAREVFASSRSDAVSSATPAGLDPHLSLIWVHDEGNKDVMKYLKQVSAAFRAAVL